MFKRERRDIPKLNTSSTADISFMLLILFLVTTSLDMNKGVDRQLPPIDKTEDQRPTPINARMVMKCSITADNKIVIDDKTIDKKQIKNLAFNFIKARGKEHIIQIQADRKASYDTYFQLQNQIIAAYNALRNEHSLATFGKGYDLCSNEQKAVINEEVPQRISEVYTMSTEATQKGGAE